MAQQCRVETVTDLGATRATSADQDPEPVTSQSQVADLEVEEAELISTSKMITDNHTMETAEMETIEQSMNKRINK